MKVAWAQGNKIRLGFAPSKTVCCCLKQLKMCERNHRVKASMLQVHLENDNYFEQPVTANIFR